MSFANALAYYQLNDLKLARIHIDTARKLSYSSRDLRPHLLTFLIYEALNKPFPYNLPTNPDEAFQWMQRFAAQQPEAEQRYVAMWGDYLLSIRRPDDVFRAQAADKNKQFLSRAKELLYKNHDERGTVKYLTTNDAFIHVPLSKEKAEYHSLLATAYLYLENYTEAIRQDTIALENATDKAMIFEIVAGLMPYGERATKRCWIVNRPCSNTLYGI